MSSLQWRTGGGSVCHSYSGGLVGVQYVIVTVEDWWGFSMS